MKYLLPLFSVMGMLLWLGATFTAKPNCEAYKGNDLCYKACQECMVAISFRQGSYNSQDHFDKAIELCPTFDYAWYEKAVPYLKRGQFIEWKRLIDQAVTLNPTEHLGYRGWCRYQFLRDYEGAIADIEELESLVKYDIGFSVNGDYHLVIAKALCYKALGQTAKAAEMIETFLATSEYSAGPYDYLHLGVMQWELGDWEKAQQYLEQQLEENDYLADTYYYLAQVAAAQCEIQAYQQHLTKALEFYQQDLFLMDYYSHPMDRIYRAQIEQGLQQMPDCQPEKP